MSSMNTGQLIIAAMLISAVSIAAETQQIPEDKLEQKLDSLTIGLIDGSNIIGVPDIEAIPVKTSYTKMNIPIVKIQSIAIDDKHESATFVLLNGDIVTGVINIEELSLQTVVGLIKIRIPLIKSIHKPARVYLKKMNVALASRGAKATAPKNAANLNDGNSTKYTGSTGFAHGSFPCDFGVELSEPTKISAIRFLLWDGDQRSYRYKVKVSIDGKVWKSVADHSKDERKGWQEIEFPYQSVKHIKIQGLNNTNNKAFHIVELEAY